MNFTKMQAAGNDFVIFNGLQDKIIDYKNLAIKACDRHYSVGGDGIMVVLKSKVADIKMMYLNSDGSIGEMCGNGIRCFSKFVYENNLVSKKKFTVETLAGIKTVYLVVDNGKVQRIRVSMGTPIIDPKNVPVLYNGKDFINQKINIDGKPYNISTIKVGVPHTILFVNNINSVNVNKLGAIIEKHHMFPLGTNVNFIEICSSKKIKIYTWERGAGRTLACGTGACASVVVGHILNLLNHKVEVQSEGGIINIELSQDLEIFMEGTASIICTGKFVDFGRPQLKYT